MVCEDFSTSSGSRLRGVSQASEADALQLNWKILHTQKVKSEPSLLLELNNSSACGGSNKKSLTKSNCCSHEWRLASNQIQEKSPTIITSSSGNGNVENNLRIHRHWHDHLTFFLRWLISFRVVEQCWQPIVKASPSLASTLPSTRHRNHLSLLFVVVAACKTLKNHQRYLVAHDTRNRISSQLLTSRCVLTPPVCRWLARCCPFTSLSPAHVRWQRYARWANRI